ncbi:MAG: DUF58 domain-containing protein [Acidobacteriota bacterium]
MIAPSPRLIALMTLAGLAAVVWPGAGLAGAGGLAVAALVDAGLSGRRRRGIRAAAVEPVRCQLGVPAKLTVPVTAPVGARVSVALPPELELADGPGNPWTFTPRERGRYRVEALAVEVVSPGGLWEWRERLRPEVEIRVYPRVRGAQEMGALRRAMTGSRQVRQVGRGREFEKLREYSAGDSFQDVHWKATARRGTPITRTYQIERTQEIYCLVDRGRLQARRQEGQTVLDWSVTAALHLALAAERRGDRLGLLAFSDRIDGFVGAGSGAAHLAACQEMLYPLQPSEAVTDYAEAATYLRTRLPRRVLLVVLTSLDDRASAEPFARAAQLLGERHLVAVVAARAPGAEPLFSGPPAVDEAAVYRSLGGHLVWRGLRELQLELGRQGVRLAYEEPREMGLRALTMYEEIRQRQLL